MPNSDAKTFGIYIPSCHRSDRIVTHKVLNHCTYVVRASEEQLYKDSGILNVLAVPDQDIDSLPKTRQWIIDNTPEDIVVQIDDDIERFSFVNKNNYEAISDKDIVDIELLRIAQIMSDLKLGFASIQMQENVLKYSCEFKFFSTIGLVCWYNKSDLKGHYDPLVTTKADMDFELQELFHNRIILIPSYLRVKAKYDKNKGGNNTAKTSVKVQQNVDYLKRKWGKHFDHNFKNNTSRVFVKR